MKKMFFEDEFGTENVIMGTAQEIKAVYNSIMRNKNNDICPSHCGKAVFNPTKMYGLSIDEDNTMYVLSSDTCTRYLLEYENQK